ncbi:MAG: hypothetical protein IPP63_13860 [Chloracidobacterium sp.]|nr:hypothetical protein [Chloracidobacterium sp.]
MASADFATSNEFQRADCEPSATKGNGTVDLGDFIQAGRYAAVLDPWTSVGGPGLPIPAPAIAESIFGTPMAVNSIPRVVRVVNVDASPGSQVTVSIEINAENSDKGISFTMDYDPSKLSNPVVNGGSGASGAVVIPNTTIPGKVIVQLAYITGGFASGVSQALTVKFDVATTAPSGANAFNVQRHACSATGARYCKRVGRVDLYRRIRKYSGTDRIRRSGGWNGDVGYWTADRKYTSDTHE